MRLLILATACILSMLAWSADNADTLLSHTRRRAGICVLIENDDVKLVNDLVEKSRFLIYVQHSDRAVVEKLRTQLAPVGVLGRRVLVADGDTVPFGQDMVDLILLPDDASAALRQSAQFALTPMNGVLLADGKTWRKPFPKGADAWTHRWHGPDNNPLSRDSLFKLPSITRWLAKPYNLSLRRCTDLIAGGRIVIVSRAPGVWKPNDDRADIFICLNQANGLILWQRHLPKLFVSGQPNLVLTEDTLYMALGPKVARIDPETGEDLDPVMFKNPAGHIKWMALAGGKLAVLFGENDTSAEFPGADFTWQKSLKGPNEKLTDHGRVMAIQDLQSQRELWRHDAGADITVRMLAIRDGKLYYHAQDSHVVALDFQSGRTLWKTTDKAVLSKLHENRKGFDGIVGDADRGMTAQPEALVFGNLATSHVTALDPETGKLLWAQERGRKKEFSAEGRVMKWVADGGVLYKGGKDLDLRTGKPLEDSTKFSLPGCGIMTGSANGFFGTCGIGFDRASGTATKALADIHKTPCDTGTFVADGTMFSPGGPCTCAVVSRGLKLAAPRGNINVNKKASTQNLWRSKDLSAQSIKLSKQGWRNARGPVGTGFAAVQLGGKPKEVWRFEPKHPYAGDLKFRRFEQENRLTPAILVGGLLVHASLDGSVTALGSASGKIRWKAWTSGPIYMPPSFAQDRIYVGSADGHAYCFEAASGRLLWRFRAAPHERLLQVNGHISSNWPVHSGVLVHDGVAYFGAGLMPEDGAHLYAVDAKTGSIRWQNNELGNQPDKPNAGRVPLGGMVVAQGRLWVQCLGYGASAFDLNSGAILPIPKRFDHPSKPQGAMGKELFGFQDTWMLRGGQRLLADHYERDGSTYKIGRWVNFDFMKLDPNGLPQWPIVLMPETLQAPVWDDSLFVTTLSYRRKVEGWDVGKLLEFLDKKRNSVKDKEFPFYRREKAVLLKVGRKTIEKTPMRLWERPDLNVNCMALTNDAVVLTHRYREKRRGPVSWRLTALERTTGKDRWFVDLPGEPLMDGLVVDGQGQIFVLLRTGQVLAFGK